MTATSLPCACRPVSFPTLGDAASYRCHSCGRWHLSRRPPFDVNDPDDRCRAELAAAGWRQVNNPAAEFWVAPGVSVRNTSARKKPLADAWRALQTAGRRVDVAGRPESATP
jgi:hypothetical protein